MVFHKSKVVIAANVAGPFLEQLLKGDISSLFREFSQISINNTPISAIDWYRVFTKSKIEINGSSSNSDGARRVNLLVSGNIIFIEPDPLLGVLQAGIKYSCQQYFNIASKNDEFWIQSWLLLIN